MDCASCISGYLAALSPLAEGVTFLSFLVVSFLEAPSLYNHLSPLLNWDQSSDGLSSDALKEMEEKNAAQVKSLEEKVEDAKENAGDMEVLDARFEVARFVAN